MAIRRPWHPRRIFAAVWLALLVPLIFVVFHVVLDRTSEQVLTEEVRHETLQWVEFLTLAFPEFEDIARNGRSTAEAVERLQYALDGTGILQLEVFDAEGKLRFVHDEALFIEAGGRTFSATAAEVAKSGESVAHSIRADQEAGGPSVWPALRAVAFTPVRSGSGEVFGVLLIHVDLTAASARFHSGFRLLGLILPLASALLYLLPAAAWRSAESRRSERDLMVRRLSNHDSLTGLLNRGAFTGEAEDLFTDRADPIGVLFADADRLKEVNDTFGHEYGDAYLRHIAGALKAAVRPGDPVARIGGDEFIAVLPGIDRPGLQAAANACLDALREPCEHKGTRMAAGASLGMHLSRPKENLEAAMHAADLALYEAKQVGRGRVASYSPALDKALQRRREVETALRTALKGEGVAVAYQPFVRARDVGIAGFEALARLPMPDGTLASPLEFVPIAEGSGLIHEMGMSVLRQALRAVADFPEDIFVSVNLSPAQFRRERLAEQVLWQLETFGFPAERLELEVTESLLLHRDEDVYRQIEMLRNAGISIAVDDFGTGYSSLQYLLDFRFEKLKIDQFFLSAEKDTERSMTLLKTIVAMGHQLGMKVAVEGVETEEQLAMLDAMDCDLLQGYLFGKPVTAAEALAMIGANRSGLETGT